MAQMTKEETAYVEYLNECEDAGEPALPFDEWFELTCKYC